MRVWPPCDVCGEAARFKDGERLLCALHLQAENERLRAELEALKPSQETPSAPDDPRGTEALRGDYVAPRHGGSALEPMKTVTPDAALEAGESSEGGVEG